MTREQAIKQLESLRAHCDSMFDDKWSEHEVWGRDVLAIDIAIATIAAIEDILGDEYDLDRLRELAQADREGRCVVLPCKVGDPVYMATGRSRITGYEEDICDGFFIDRTGKLQIKAQNYTGNHGTYGSLEDGSVQLTRESAEKALEEMEANENG